MESFLVFSPCACNLPHSCLMCPGKLRKTLAIDIILSLVLSVSYFNGITEVKTKIMGNEGE